MSEMNEIFVLDVSPETMKRISLLFGSNVETTRNIALNPFTPLDADMSTNFEQIRRERNE